MNIDNITEETVVEHLLGMRDRWHDLNRMRDCIDELMILQPTFPDAFMMESTIYEAGLRYNSLLEMKATEIANSQYPEGSLHSLVKGKL